MFVTGEKGSNVVWSLYGSAGGSIRLYASGLRSWHSGRADLTKLRRFQAYASGFKSINNTYLEALDPQATACQG